jgi:hypothetical protein
VKDGDDLRREWVETYPYAHLEPSIPIGIVSTESPTVQIDAGGQVSPLTGHYAYQRGDLFYRVETGETGNIASPGPGIRRHAILGPFVDGSVVVSGHFPESEELRLI